MSEHDANFTMEIPAGCIAAALLLLGLDSRNWKRTMTKRRKYYAVAKGRKTGVFETWEECSEQVKGYASARFKSFRSKAEALGFLETSPAKTTQGSDTGGAGKRSLDAADDAMTGNDDRQKKRPCINVHGATDPPARSPYYQKSESSELPAHQIKPVGRQGSVARASAATTKRELKVHINFDGGSRGNPGIAGAGAIITLNEQSTPEAGGPPFRKTIRVRDFLPGKATNNEAEYRGVIAALSVAQKEVEAYSRGAGSSSRPLLTHLVIQGDSQLIVKQLTGTYRCNNAKLKPLLAKVKALLSEFHRTGECHVSVEHVYREHNAQADGVLRFAGCCAIIFMHLTVAVLLRHWNIALANQAMDAQRSWMTYDHDEGNEFDLV